jgi:hypothetical protein
MNFVKHVFNKENILISLSIVLVVVFIGLIAFTTDQQSLKYQVSKIKSDFGIQVFYKYYPHAYFSKRWLSAPITAKGSQISDEEAKRLLPIINRFLSVYPKHVLNKNLHSIYLAENLEFYGKSFAGSNNKKSIYIKSWGFQKGFTDDFLLGLMYSEFSSILIRNYNFPHEIWGQQNPAYFEYSGSGVAVLHKHELYAQTEDLLHKGFLTRYSQSSWENDFNQFAAWLFIRPHQLEKLGRSYPRIAKKSQLAMSYYKTIDPQISFGHDSR